MVSKGEKPCPFDNLGRTLSVKYEMIENGLSLDRTGLFGADYYD